MGIRAELEQKEVYGGETSRGRKTGIDLEDGRASGAEKGVAREEGGRRMCAQELNFMSKVRYLGSRHDG